MRCPEWPWPTLLRLEHPTPVRVDTIATFQAVPRRLRVQQISYTQQKGPTLEGEAWSLGCLALGRLWLLGCGFGLGLV